MAGADAIVRVDFVANTRGLRQGASEASSASSKIGSSLKSIGKAGAFAGVAAGIAGVTFALKTGISEYMATQKVAAQTNAVIKSTGAVANVSAAHVSSLAESLMKKSGVDDEAIASGENLLLTFTNIRNEAGKGNDVFDQATKATLDLSKAFGKDMASSSVLVGKALNDPVKGITALSRVGVTFTAQQKKAIKALVDTGDTAGAQKLILKELNREVGGSAEAYGKTLPGQIAIAKETFNNLTGEIVAKTIPVLTSMIGWLRDHWPEISAALKAAWAIIGPLLSALGNLFVAVASLIAEHWPQIRPIVTTIANIVRIAVGVIVSVLKLLTALLRGDWSQAWIQAQNIVRGVVKLITAIVKAEVALWRAILTAAWSAIKAGVAAAWNGIKSLVGSAVSWITARIAEIPGKIGAIVAATASAAVRIGTGIANGIKHGVSAAISWIGSELRSIPGKLTSAAGSIGSAASRIGSAIASGIKAGVSAAISWIESELGKIPGKILSIVKKIPGAGAISGIVGKSASAAGVTAAWPALPQLAAGGVLTRPTLFVGGEAGREIVTPEKLLRSIMAEERAGSSYTLNLYSQRADAADIAYGFRRLELLEAGR